MTEIDVAVRRVLDATGFGYDVIECEPEFADTADFCAKYGYAPEISANTILVIGKSDPPRYAACVVTAVSKLDVNGKVRHLLGVRKASFAGAEETASLTGMSIGGVTALALPEGVPLYVDEPVMSLERIILGGGSRSWKVQCAPAVLTAIGAEVIAGLGMPRDPP